MKIFISGPISKTTDYMERFNEAERTLKDSGFEVVNPAAVCASLPESTTHDQYMELTMAMLKWCDGIYQLKGWKGSLGARQEYGYAYGRDMDIAEEGDFLPFVTPESDWGEVR